MDKRTIAVVSDFIEAEELWAKAGDAFNSAQKTANRILMQAGPMPFGSTQLHTGYGFKGKKLKVDDVRVTRDWFEGVVISAYGNIIKADGKPGLRRGSCKMKFPSGERVQ